MPESGSKQRLSWFEGVLKMPAPQPKESLSERPPGLSSDGELDRLELALQGLAGSDNAADERRSLMASLKIVDPWYQSAKRSGAEVDNASLSDLVFRLVEWKRSA
jgi:hypothetical protein